MTEPRRVKIDEIEAFTADYRRRRGIPGRPKGRGRSPAEMAARLQAEQDRLEWLSRLFRGVFPPDPERVP